MVMLKAKLRPGWVDWDLYQRVQVQLEPIERVAKEMWLSPEKVLHWVEQIMAYVLVVTTQEVADDAAAGRPTEPAEARMAKELASARIGHLTNLALQAYEDSKGWQTVVRRSEGKEPKSVATYSAGNQKYLMTMARLQQMQAKLAAPRLGRFFVDEPMPSASDGQNHSTFAAAALQMTAAEEEALQQRYREHQAAAAVKKYAAAEAKAATAARFEAKDQLPVDEANEQESKAVHQGETDHKNHPQEACSAAAVNSGSGNDDDNPDRPLNNDELATCVAKYWANKEARKFEQQPVQLDDPGGVQARRPKDKKARRKAFLNGG